MVLYAVLILVLAAFGLLVAALASAHTMWAWISVAVSVVAAALLVADWWIRRRARGAGSWQVDDGGTAGDEDIGAEDRDAEETGDADTAQVPVGRRAGGGSAEGRVGAEPLGAGTAPLTDGDSSEELGPDGEPPVEETDAADILVVADLDDEVHVIDERPRYHLPSCGWLADRPTIPLPVREARQLGFTPCGRCTPDAKLAAAHRRSRA
jgi:hypothetical protein